MRLDPLRAIRPLRSSSLLHHNNTLSCDCLTCSPAAFLKSLRIVYTEVLIELFRFIVLPCRSFELIVIFVIRLSVMNSSIMEEFVLSFKLSLIFEWSSSLQSETEEVYLRELVEGFIFCVSRRIVKVFFSKEFPFFKGVLLGDSFLWLRQKVVESLLWNVYHSSVRGTSLLIAIIIHHIIYLLGVFLKFIIVIIRLALLQRVINSHWIPLIRLFYFLSLTQIPIRMIILASLIASFRSLPVTYIILFFVLLVPSFPTLLSVGSLSVLLLLLALRLLEIIVFFHSFVMTLALN